MHAQPQGFADACVTETGATHNHILAGIVSACRRRNVIVA
jgi:hypothetical protein